MRRISMRPVLPLVAVIACSTGAIGDATVATPPPAHQLEERARYTVLAGGLAFAADGQRWAVAGDHDLVIYDGSAETGRFPDLASGVTAIDALPNGRWIAGARIVGGDGKVQFDGYSWAQKFGRFGHAAAFAASPNGRVAIVAGADAPSMCLCDRGRPEHINAGALVRLAFGEGAPAERVLVDHASRDEYAVAASDDSIAAASDGQIQIWPTRGDGAAISVKLAGGKLAQILWSGDRYLVARRWVDVDHDEVMVFDRAAKFANPTSFVTNGTIRGLALRPGHDELAIALTRYRATTQVWVDEKELEVVGFDGAQHASVAVTDYPVAVAWSPDGGTLLLSVPSTTPTVIRYLVK